jgi:hypothetical protein
MSTAPTETARPTLAGKLVALGGVLVSAAYLSNLGAGVLGEIPDVVPGLGNLDEVFFSGLLILSLAKLGINVIPNLQAPKSGPPTNLSGPK